MKRLVLTKARGLHNAELKSKKNGGLTKQSEEYLCYCIVELMNRIEADLELHYENGTNMYSLSNVKFNNNTGYIEIEYKWEFQKCQYKQNQSKYYKLDYDKAIQEDLRKISNHLVAEYNHTDHFIS